MYLLDVNVLLYAHREEFPQHETSRAWLEDLLSSGDGFAVSDGVLSAFVRLVTNHRWIDSPSTLDQAFAVCSEIRSAPGFLDLAPGPRHWEIFERLCKTTDSRGDYVPDAFIAALAIENNAEFASFDRGLRRFPGLRLFTPTLP